MRKNNHESQYLDATLNFIKHRGSDHGMKLSAFVQGQLQLEEKALIHEELDLGCKTMKILEKKPNEHILRYWKDKIMHIKAYIKAGKFDIQIPKELNFMDQFEEEME